jgi:hypothetical protein
MPSRPLPGFKRERNRLPTHAQRVSPRTCGGRTHGNTGAQQAPQAPQAFSPSRQPPHGGRENEASGGGGQAASGAHGLPYLPVAPVAPVADQEDQGLPRNRLANKPVAETLKPVAAARLLPPPGSLHARLCAAGATVRTYGTRGGATATIEAPAGLPGGLVREVEARGWHIIPGGRRSSEAEQDSWPAGAPSRERKG